MTGGRINDIGANLINQGGPISSGSNGLVSGPASRTSNMLMCLTPVFSGVQLAAGYIPMSEGAAAGVNTNGKGNSVQTNYNNGQIALKYDHTVVTIANTGIADPVAGIPQNTGDKLMGTYWFCAPLVT